MSEFPLYDLVSTHPEPLSPMEAYLRDDGKTWEEIEERRKSELKIILQDWKEGKHSILVLLSALETIFGAYNHNSHPLAHIPKHVHAKNFSDNRAQFKKDEEPKTPEDLEYDEKTRIERIIKHNFEYLREPKLVKVDSIIKELEDENTRSIDIIGSINYLISPSSRDKIYKQLSILHSNEDIDNLVHPNDQYIDDDILDVLFAHKEHRSYAENATINEYQTQEDIDLRRLTEISNILEEWKQGAHPFLVMTDILAIAIDQFDNPLMDLINSAKSENATEESTRHEKPSAPDEQLAYAERERVKALLALKNIRRQAKQIIRTMKEEIVSYRGPNTHPEFAEGIDAFIEHIASGDERSLSIIQGVAETMFKPVDDQPHMKKTPNRGLYFGDEGETDIIFASQLYNADAPLLTKIRVTLKHLQEKEDIEFEKNKPMGELHTQTEEESKKSLSDIFQLRAKRQRRPKHKPLPKLVNEIHIAPSGSGMIKPFPSGKYDQRFEEELYGTITARITTYSVTFAAKDPERVQELAGYVKWALKKLADAKPAFEIPFDNASEPYIRPQKAGGYSQYAYLSAATLHVNITDNKVQPIAPLDLDDTWSLYYLLEDIIEPSEQIAFAINNARYAEERGVLLMTDGMDSPYSNENMKPEEQMGSLDQEDPEDYVPEMMKHSLYLHALGEIDEEQFLQRILVLADHTLSGRMADPDGILPTFNRITDQSKSESRAIITYDEALMERTRKILMILTGTHDEDRPLFPALIKKVSEISRPLRDKLRQTALMEKQEWEDRMWEDMTSKRNIWSERFGFDFNNSSKKKADEDQLDTQQEDEDESEASEEKTQKKEKQRSLAYSANIALRNSDVGATTDRSWRDTDYVSRSKNSLWVRKELPSALKPFIRTQNQPDMGQALRAITHEKS